MFEKSRGTIAVALISAAALTSISIPASARSVRYCDQHVRYADREDDAFNPMLILPLAAIGGGIGAGVGALASGISIGTGAAVGAGTGAGLGLFKGVVYHNHHDYRRAYRECRAE